MRQRRERAAPAGACARRAEAKANAWQRLRGAKKRGTGPLHDRTCCLRVLHAHPQRLCGTKAAKQAWKSAEEEARV